jgi:hypothetical protein
MTTAAAAPTPCQIQTLQPATKRNTNIPAVNPHPYCFTTI